jgi:hypothetical protein
MKSIVKGTWTSKRGPTPSIPAYRAPRKAKSNQKAVREVVQEILIVDGEESLEREETKSDSEEDTCFGVVWERLPMTQLDVTAGVMIEANEEHTGVELIWDKDRDGGGKDAVVIPEHWTCPYAGLVIPETEFQDSDLEEDNIPVSQLLKRQKETVVDETESGMKDRARFFAWQQFWRGCCYYNRNCTTIFACEIHTGWTYPEIRADQAFDLYPVSK